MNVAGVAVIGMSHRSYGPGDLRLIPWLDRAFGCVAIATFGCCGAARSIIRARQHGAGPAAVGVMLAVIGLGGLAGALVAPSIARRAPSAVIVIGTFWVEAMLFPLLLLTHDPYVLGAITALAALLGPAWNAVVVGARLTLTPDRLRGRVNSAARLISGSLLALGPLAAGILSQNAGTTNALVVLASWQLLLALAATASTSLRGGVPQDRRPGSVAPLALSGGARC